ncbi:helix-turn-helix transcriptional regulator [Nocardia sp. NPDC058058]|uniref:helix-turn-helix transcriptional regulator n=1 Tax=Nocardia sp. NPDC058058 TaxID=3346317 RepID=UPI0036D86AB9
MTAAEYDGPAPDMEAVAVVRAVIAHQHSIKEMTAALGLAGESADYLSACAEAILPPDPTPAQILAVLSPAGESVRRAVAFMNENLREEVDVADIAAASFVSVRAMQLAFRHELDTTPMAFLRDLRMRAAHEELEDCMPGDGATVTGIAAGWGFPHPGRFAIAYRRVYGQSPHTTMTE